MKFSTFIKWSIGIGVAIVVLNWFKTPTSTQTTAAPGVKLPF